MKKVIFLLVMLAVLTGLLWGNGQQESNSDDSLLIGGVMYDLSNKFHTYIQDAMMEFDS